MGETIGRSGYERATARYSAVETVFFAQFTYEDATMRETIDQSGYNER